MNEMQALMGILVLKHIDELVEKGRSIEAIYRERLAGVPGIRIPPPLPPNVRYNHGYLPIEVDEAAFGMSRDRLHEELKKLNIHARRYFYPLIPDFACYRHIQTRDPLTVARGVAERILVLPKYHDMALNHVSRICSALTRQRVRRATPLVAGG
jgi:dTDP-4-amino-4,6-dideoxygalactose transaminase